MSDRLLEILEDTCRESGAPAAAGIVVSHDAVVAQAAVGVRRLGDETPVTIEDKFHIGSNTKSMTATICAMRVYEGLLRWDTTPVELFPDLRGTIHQKFATVTLEMLLRHMAGIPPFTEDEHYDDLPEFTGSPTEQRFAFARWLLQEQEPINEPGTASSYSNAGYSIAAALAEAAARRSWESMLQNDLWAPLGMEAGFGWPALHDSRQPWGHRVKGGQVTPHPPDDAYRVHTFTAPAGDVHVSMPHYGRFLQMNLKALQGRETLLPTDLLRRLHNHGKPGVGTGWGVQTIRAMEEMGPFSVHAGSAGTFLIIAGVSHDRDRAIAIVTNAGDEEDMSVDKVVANGFKEIIRHYVGRA